MTAFTLQRDTTNVPVMGYDSVLDVLKTRIVDQYGNPISSSNPVPTQPIQSPLSAAVTMQNAAGTTGTGTVLPTSGYGTAIIAIDPSISPTWAGTIEFDGQGPDGNWYPINARSRGTSIIGTTTTAGGLFELNCRGLQAVRANLTACTAGTVTVKGQAQNLPAAAADDIVTTQLTGSKKTLQSSFLTPTFNIPATTGVQQFQFIPSSGTIARLKYIGLYIPALTGVTTGAQYALLSVGTSISWNVNQIISKSSTGTAITFANSDNVGAVVGITFDTTNPLVITIQNTTNVAQTGQGAYQVIWEEEAIII